MRCLAWGSPDGQRLAIELGAPEYTADTFGSKRYTLLATRSSGHSVPLVNGQEQASGSEFSAELLDVVAGTDEVSIQLDLTKAYPAVGQRRLLRQIRLDGNAACLTVEDQLWADEPCSLESVLITASDNAEVLGLEPLPGSQLAGKECLRFRDNRGEELTAWRWCWQAAVTPPICDGNEPQCVGYVIRPAGN
ncbi:hypothetical protein [Cyanobium sp. NS01]|uniref:hypothetical protein n=1 Tax=Cyanobium sp. NS01 TaxID=261284 RepID=UPI001646E39E|nr:hypothetical protein [Cyanobium sp. NS01]QNI71248.1 heparinase II/III-like family protein [Cyanobium sp. NS01]